MMFGPHLADRDLTIASCAPAIAESVAELTLAELAIGLKRVLENSAANRTGVSRRPANSKTLAECTVGLVGASHVGRAVLRMLQPFRPKVLVYDPFVSTEEIAAAGGEKVDSLVELCRRSNAVTLHTPALDSTRHIIGRQELQAMPDDAVFVNTARGMCVDEHALITELSAGRLFAFLDVSDPEPPAADSPLRTLPNVVFTSHIAGGVNSAIGRQAVDDVTAFLHGESPAMAVTTDMLDRVA